MAKTVALYFLLTLFSVTGILTLFLVVRQIFLTYFMVGRKQTSPYSYMPLTDDQWPTVTIMVAAHNEELVIEGCIDNLSKLDYPEGKLDVLIINDRSKDRTRELVDATIAKKGGAVRALHREDGALPGKAAAISDGLKTTDNEILIFFDADYLPEPELLKKLVAPFMDPQIGGIMGRVVPDNTNSNVLTRILDDERRAGYTIDQAARAEFNLLPQFGGTCGGIRIAAMNEVGGWASNTLAEDTDMTYRLFIGGYDVAYVDDAVCYEESPENWTVRLRQVRRWACGHDQCFLRYFLPTLFKAKQPLIKRIDAAMVLTFYLLPALSFASLLATLVYPTMFSYPPINFGVVTAMAFAMAFGNFAPYLQMMGAAIRDRQPEVIRMMPLIAVSSTISMLASTHGLWLAMRNVFFGRTLKWDKTVRYRKKTLANA